MFKITKPARAGVAFAMSSFLSMCLLAPACHALAVVIFNPPEQAKPALPPEKVAELSKHDVIVFIDSSRSMSRSVGPEKRWYSPPPAAFPTNVAADKTRWQWCSEQTQNLSNDLKNILKDHLKVVLFSDNFKVYKDVDMESVPHFFSANRPYGNTNATKALRSQLKQYFAARDAASEKPRPLLVAMITDGCPDDPLLLRQTIIEASNKMHDSDEIAITFLQVGVDPGATKYLRELDECLVGSKAKYDIVSAKSFDQLNQSGLSLALLDAVHK